MNNNIRVFYLILAACFFCACSDHNSRSSIVFVNLEGEQIGNESEYNMLSQIDSLQAADPVANAYAAFERGDKSFIALLGVGLFVPCLDVHDDAKQRLKLKIIAGGKGAGSVDEAMLFNDLVKSYAKKYNQEMIVLLSHGASRR